MGVFVGKTTVRAIALARGRVIWAAEAELDDDRLSDAIVELLHEAPVSLGLSAKLRRPTLVVAAGASRSQVRWLRGLPPVRHADMLAALVQENAGRFFLRNGVPLVTSVAFPESDGESWAAAIEEPVVVAARAAARRSGLTLAAVVPAAVAVARARGDGRHVIADGEFACEIDVAGGQLETVRRLPVRVGDGERPMSRAVAEESPVEREAWALAALGEHASRFSEAFAAAVLGVTAEPLALRADGAGGPGVERARLIVPAIVALLAMTCALFAPAFASVRAERSAREELSALAARRLPADRAEKELALVSDALGEFVRFDRGRRSQLELLHDLTAALPEQTALVSLRVDSAAGTATILGDRAATMLSALEHVEGIASPALTGPITREVVAADELDRVAVRFRLVPVQHP